MAIAYATAVRTDRMTTTNTDIGASCKIELYTGTRPASPQVAVSTQTLLVTLTGNAGGFGSVTSGVLTAAAITSGVAVGAGTATWFRLFKSDGTTVVMDGNVGASGSDLNINNTSIAIGQTVACASWVMTEGDA